VDFRLVGSARDRRRALVNEAVKGANFAASGGVVEIFSLPDLVRDKSVFFILLVCCGINGMCEMTDLAVLEKRPGPIRGGR
jgi:hypothetical protein